MSTQADRKPTRKPKFTAMLFGRRDFFTAKHPVEHVRWWIACLGVWICNHFYPRPVTESERGHSLQYCRLMVDSLRGEIPWYGRDREQLHTPVIAERSWWAKRNDKEEIIQ
jgi:hypothetical protein